MAIRLVHQPVGIGGLAAYAAGRGRAQERQRKYATDMALTQQARRDRYNLLEQQQQFDLQRDAKRFVLGEVAAAGRAQQRAGEIRQRADLQKERDDRIFERQDIAEERRRAERDIAGLEIPDWVDPGDRIALEKKKAAAKDFLRSDLDLQDDDVRDKFSGAIQDFNSYIEGLPGPTPLEDQFKKDVIERDGRQYQYNRRTGQWDVLTEAPKPDKPFVDQYNDAMSVRSKAQENFMKQRGMDPNDLTTEQEQEVEDFGKQVAPVPLRPDQKPITNPDLDVRGGTQMYGGGSQGLPPGQRQQQAQAGQPQRIANDADFDALPSGATFIAPDGTLRRKP